MRKSIQPLSRRVLSRLAVATANELDLWLRDDVKIAHRTVLHAAYGDAVLCSPDVLSSYEILGIHPEKVWPAIQARSDALGPLDVAEAPPKKAAQSAKLWPEETNEARVASPCLAVSVLREPTTRPPMAAPSIAALYPKSDDPSSAKKRDYSYDDLLLVVRKSHAPASIVAATVNAVTARGRWPEYDGPVSKILCVSLDGMMLGGGDGDRNVVRSTAQLSWATGSGCARQTPGRIARSAEPSGLSASAESSTRARISLKAAAIRGARKLPRARPISTSSAALICTNSTSKNS